MHEKVRSYTKATQIVKAKCSCTNSTINRGKFLPGSRNVSVRMIFRVVRALTMIITYCFLCDRVQYDIYQRFGRIFYRYLQDA